MKAHLVLIASTLLAGCSNSPSSGDIEKALEAAVGPCQNVEVVDVKKTNGYEEDGYYRVEYKFGLEVKEKAKLRKLYEEWRSDNERFEAKQKVNNELSDRINQLHKEAEALSAAVGPEPQESDFDHLNNSSQKFDAYHAARIAWRDRANAAARPKEVEISKLQDERSQLPPLKFVVIGKESEVTMNFFYAGCSSDALHYFSAAIPEMPRSNGMVNPEARLSFTRADLTGKMSMRKTENGWRKI